jgi:hypothetical protein
MVHRHVQLGCHRGFRLCAVRERSRRHRHPHDQQRPGPVCAAASAARRSIHVAPQRTSPPVGREEMVRAGPTQVLVSGQVVEFFGGCAASRRLGRGRSLDGYARGGHWDLLFNALVPPPPSTPSAPGEPAAPGGPRRATLRCARIELKSAQGRISRCNDLTVGADGRANRLANESSPYLKQHQFNPVDWYPWGERPSSGARRDKPILLSIGYWPVTGVTS